jgi:hypothetical protein
MTANTLKLGRALVLLAGLGVAASAVGQPEPAPQRAAEELSARKDDAVLPQADPKLAPLLEQLEAKRRKNRAGALEDPQVWAAGRAQRRAERRQEIAQVWGSVVNTIDGQAKLRLHAERMSRLNRMLDLAEHATDKALVTRIRTDIKRELVRHVKAMQVTLAASGTR